MTTGTVTGVHDRLYIGGEWVKPAGDETIAVLNPATEEEIARIPAGTAEDVDRAVTAARAAFTDGRRSHRRNVARCSRRWPRGSASVEMSSLSPSPPNSVCRCRFRG